LQAQSPYSASKISADKIIESFHLSFDLPAVTVRPFNTYGPRQSARAIIPTIIAQALESNVLRLGSLDAIRDLTYVSDTVLGFIRAAETDNAVGVAINLGTGNAVSIREMVETVLYILNKECEVVCDRQRLRPEKSEVWNLQATTLLRKR
jgi:dTDP-glucose 4,6-dehydratase